MANLKINTDAVLVAANNIKRYNTQMREEFSDVRNAIRKLDTFWDGAAATAAFNKFNELESNYAEARYNVLNNYVNFLLQQVGEGYAQTEDVNTSLAAQFK